MPGPAQELYVCLTRQQAQVAGFGRDNRHHQNPAIEAWWPGLGIMHLEMRRFPRVTVDSAVRFGVRDEAKDREIAECLRRLKIGQQVFGAHAVWIEG